MAETPTCSCGQNEPKRIIFPCAGQANAGQLTNLAAIQLTEEGYGSIACASLLAIGSEGLVRNAQDVDEVLVLDGCPMECAKKIAEAQGVPVGQHLVMTELGITKGPSKSYTDDDIEKIVAACWKGEGRKKDTAKPGKRAVEMTAGAAAGVAGPADCRSVQRGEKKRPKKKRCVHGLKIRKKERLGAEPGQKDNRYGNPGAGPQQEEIR